MERLGREDVAEVVSVLSEAFVDYPVMRFVLGSERDYATRLDALVTFFVMARILRGEVLLGVRQSSELAATALVSYPRNRASPIELAAVRDETWARLGEGARARYEAFGAATSQFVIEADHIHLAMIGVRPSAQGRGLGRRLLEAVHNMSASDPSSSGVTLTTELESNLPLYQRFGYEVIGSAPVAAAFTTWTMFRRDAR